MEISEPTNVELPPQYAHLKTQQAGPGRSRGVTLIKAKPAPAPQGGNSLAPPSSSFRPHSAPSSSNMFLNAKDEKQLAAEAKAREKAAIAREKEMKQQRKLSTNDDIASEPVVQTCVALFDFDPQQSDDLGLKKGDVVTIEGNFNASKGWLRGKNARTGRSGVFPANYVEMEGKQSPDAKKLEAQRKKEAEKRKKAMEKQKKEEEKRQKEEAKRLEKQRKEQEKEAEKQRKAAEKEEAKRRKQSQDQKAAAAAVPGRARSGTTSQSGRVKALYDFDAQQSGDLGFKAGDIIEIQQGYRGSEGWMKGTLKGRTGVFPANYTEPVPGAAVPPPPPRRALPATPTPTVAAAAAPAPAPKAAPTNSSTWQGRGGAAAAPKPNPTPTNSSTWQGRQAAPKSNPTPTNSSTWQGRQAAPAPAPAPKPAAAPTNSTSWQGRGAAAPAKSTTSTGRWQPPPPTARTTTGATVGGGAVAKSFVPTISSGPTRSAANKPIGNRNIVPPKPNTQFSAPARGGPTVKPAGGRGKLKIPSAFQ